MSSHAKGSEFERKQAKILSLWASDGKDKDLLWRTGMSGGRHTIGALKDHGYGDLQVLKPTPEAVKFMSTFCVELKHYKTFELFSEWYNPKSNLNKWWAKLSQEAADNSVHPLLVVKQNLKPEMVFMEFRLLTCNYREDIQSLISKGILFNIQGVEVLMTLQTDWLEHLSLNQFTPVHPRPRRTPA